MHIFSEYVLESVIFYPDRTKGVKTIMAKQGMRRVRYGDIHGGRNPEDHMPKNEMKPVPEIQGKAKTTKAKANPIA